MPTAHPYPQAGAARQSGRLPELTAQQQGDGALAGKLGHLCRKRSRENLLQPRDAKHGGLHGYHLGAARPAATVRPQLSTYRVQGQWTVFPDKRCCDPA